MKVLHLIDSGGLYGAERMLLDLVQRQNQAGLGATILSSTNDANITKPLVTAAREAGLDVIEWPMADGLNLRQAKKIRDFALANQVDVLHSHGYKFTILLGLFPRWLRQLPLVCTVHGYLAAPTRSRLWWYQQVDRRLLARAEASVFVSKAMLKQPAFKTLSIRNSQVIYNGIDFDALDAIAAGQCSGNVLATYLKNPADDPGKISWVVAAGRLSAEKGYPDLIDAFSQVHRESPHTRLLIVGEGPERLSLEQRVRDHHLQDVVCMPGFVSPLFPLLTEAGVLVMSSYTEGMPMTLLEAVAAQAPVVATAVGGISEVLEGYHSATLVAPGNPRQLAAAIQESLASGRMESSVNIAPFRQRFSSAVMAQRYRALYEDVVQS